MYQEAASDVQQLVQLYSVGKKKKSSKKIKKKLTRAATLEMQSTDPEGTTAHLMNEPFPF